MIYRTGCFLFLLFLFCTTPAFAQGKERAAVAAADEFVGLIDNGWYGESWEEGAYLLQVQTAKAKWIHKLAVGHEIFGRPSQRTFRVATYRTSFPGIPDGDYFIVVFDAVYENKKAAVETLIMVDEDGEWRAADYLLR